MNKHKKLKLHKIISGLIALVGAVLMIFMIFVESEPGAIPLLLMVGGSVWYFISHARNRSSDSKFQEQ